MLRNTASEKLILACASEIAGAALAAAYCVTIPILVLGSARPHYQALQIDENDC